MKLIIFAFIFLTQSSLYSHDDHKNWGIGIRGGFTLISAPSEIDKNTATESTKGAFLNYLFDFGLGLELGFDRLDFGKTSGRVEHYSLMGTYRYPHTRFRPFIGFGLGLPKLSQFETAPGSFNGETSLNIRGGIEWDLSSSLKMMAGIHHYSFGTDGRFSEKFSVLTPILGISYHFDVPYSKVGKFFSKVAQSFRSKEKPSLKSQFQVPLMLEEIIYFESDQWFVSKKNLHSLEKIAKYLKDNPKVFMLIKGHSDQNGPRDWNQKISVLRAKSVFDRLITDYEIEKSRLTYIGLGSNEPEDLQDTREAWARNRRVEAVALTY